MNYLKNDPKGIDIPIQLAQKRLYDKLIFEYSCDVVGYGRVYTDIVDDSDIPYAYIGRGEYEEVLTNDKINGIHFFFVERESSDVISRSCLSSTDVDLIVIVNDLTKVKDDVLHYQDEEIKEDVKSFVKNSLEINSITKGKQALDGFDVSKIQFIYPYFVFKITSTINNY